MAVLDTPQAMYSGMTSPYLIQNTGYNRPPTSYYGTYEQETLARLNIQQQQHYQATMARAEVELSRFAVKEERGAMPPPPQHVGFKPYSPGPGQENVPGQANQQSKVSLVLQYILVEVSVLNTK